MKAKEHLFDATSSAFPVATSDLAISFRDGGRDMIDALRAGRAPSQGLAGARETLAFALAAARTRTIMRAILARLR